MSDTAIGNRRPKAQGVFSRGYPSATWPRRTRCEAATKAICYVLGGKAMMPNRFSTVPTKLVSLAPMPPPPQPPPWSINPAQDHQLAFVLRLDLIMRQLPLLGLDLVLRQHAAREARAFSLDLSARVIDIRVK
jgi:hypothetical protein